MNNNNLTYQVALTLINGVGAKNAKVLLAYLGNEKNIFDERLNLRTKIPGFAKKRFRSLDRKTALVNAIPIVEYVRKQNINTTFFSDKNYPKRLKECGDSPVLLYHLGNFEMNHKKTVAIVGTRNMTEYGRQLIRELLTTLIPYNVQIISGLALGVDGYAHKICLENKIPTIAVLGHGLDRIYPGLHLNLAKRMLATDGCGLITEFPNNTKPDKENFPQRNRIVAGMADATIVIESGGKGGSLITASLANDYNRDVFAFPGDVHRTFSIGCNQLIANNKAHLITSGESFIKLMGWEKREVKEVQQRNLFEGLNEDEKQVVSTIQKFEKISIDSLTAHLQKPIQLLNSLLLNLELRGLIMNLPGKEYVLAK